ncbi:MAG: PQQ-dependent sugar dehydrogenase [Dokdonella sp.]|uniref:PQQ-dependent sugar dehydrogenase n=1 Tax=Dokdonella sp. TaxID=2291710 RepID=UPI003267EC85
MGAVLSVCLVGVRAQTVPADLSLELVTSAVTAPIGVRAPHDGSGRLFVLSQAGTIRVIKDGALLPTPFLSVPVTYPGSGGTSGLLGLAFHPNYGRAGLPHNDEFYVVSMRPPGCTPVGTCLGSGPDEVLERFTVSADPDVANPAGTVVMRLADNSPPSYHNGGDIHFGADGLLYMSSGDGGQESGTHWLAECLWKKPNDTTSTSCGTGTGVQYFLRGKMLRINVDTRGDIATADMCGTPTGIAAEYSIPADNPFVGSSQTCDEIWLHGFRNPWRWSFDRATGDLWIADVGQSHFEEIDLRVAGSTGPIEYGWHCMEGTAVFNTSQACTPPLAPNVLPLIEYTHSGSRCAVTGGYRYRGPITPFQGMYVFADSCSSEIFFAKPDGPGQWSYAAWPNNVNAGSGYGTYSGFGEDEAGNLYVANTLTNKVYRFHSAGQPSTHVVTPFAQSGGHLDPATAQTVDDGTSIAFDVTVDAGYLVDSVTGCGGSLVDATFTTAPVAADCTVSATFIDDRVFVDGFESTTAHGRR